MTPRSAMLLYLVTILGGSSFLIAEVEGLGEIIYAINAGGYDHVDVHGVHYQSDPSDDGLPSDYGMRLDIQRVPQADHVLYQTERYSLKKFGYEIPIKKDGKYTVVLKFCEVYFQSKGKKVFNVLLNKEHLVISNLDIYSQVGLATAHDEYVEFVVRNKGKQLVVDGEQSEIRGGKISLQFDKGPADNPKINAFYVVKGSVEDVPKLPEISPDLEEEVNYDEYYEDDGIGIDPSMRYYEGSNKLIRSGPPKIDPWEFKTLPEKYFPVGVAVISALFSYLLVSSVVSF